MGKLKQYFHNNNDVCTVWFVHRQRTFFMIVHELLMHLIGRTNMFVYDAVMFEDLNCLFPHKVDVNHYKDAKSTGSILGQRSANRCLSISLIFLANRDPTAHGSLVPFIFNAPGKRTRWAGFYYFCSDRGLGSE